MAIRISCPNGHKLAVRETRAGTFGACPACGAKFKIPELKPEAVTESSIMRILGVGDMLRKESIGTSTFMQAGRESPSESPQSSATATQPTASPIKKTQVCPQCDWEIDAGYHICPHCRYYLMGNSSEY